MFFKVAIIILGSILPRIGELYPVFEAKSIDPFNNLIFIFLFLVATYQVGPSILTLKVWFLQSADTNLEERRRLGKSINSLIIHPNTQTDAQNLKKYENRNIY